MAKTKKQPVYTEIGMCELKDSLRYALSWLMHAHGRMRELVEIYAPLAILRNERDVWDKHIATVKGILASGRISLTVNGHRVWKDILLEYNGFPDRKVFFRETARRYRRGRLKFLQEHPEVIARQ